MDVLTVAIRFALFLDLAALFGIAAFGLYGLVGSERRSGSVLAFRPLLGGAALLGLLLSALGLATLVASMTGVPLTLVDFASVEMIVTETSAGTAWTTRVAALTLALALVLVRHLQPSATLTGTAIAGAVALASLAWGGHGVMDEGAAGWVHLTADIAHLLAAGMWVGALLALLLLLFRRPGLDSLDHLTLSHRALAGFSTVGTIVVAVIIVSGLINSWMLVGPASITKLPASLYGQLLIAKLLLFGAMCALAAVNRFRLVPTFARSLAPGRHALALGALRRSLAIEAGCGAAILLLVAWLGTLEPPLSAM